MGFFWFFLRFFFKVFLRNGVSIGIFIIIFILSLLRVYMPFMLCFLWLWSKKLNKDSVKPELRLVGLEVFFFFLPLFISLLNTKFLFFFFLEGVVLLKLCGLGGR